MLIEQEMELIESWAGHLPVRFLVEIPQSDGVGKQQVELFRHFQANRLLQVQRQHVRDGSIFLNFGSALVKARLRAYASSYTGGGLRVEILLGHRCVFSFAAQ